MPRGHGLLGFEASELVETRLLPVGTDSVRRVEERIAKEKAKAIVVNPLTWTNDTTYSIISNIIIFMNLTQNIN